MRRELTETELNTYARQVVLSEIGYEGQLKLRNAKACIVGLGGLGSIIAPKLVGMGIGQLRIVDRDIVSRSDLHRQHLYNVDSVGLPKVEVAFLKLHSLNPDVEIIPYPETLTSYNASEIISGTDVVLDGLDRPEPRYIVNRTCIRNKIPYVFGGGIETSGNITTIVPGRSLCLECFMGGLTEDDLPKCGVVGVHASILGFVASVQVFEAVRLLTGQKPQLLNKLLYADLSEMKFKKFTLSANKNCPTCGVLSTHPLESLEDKLIEETCTRDGQRTFIISPTKRFEINLDQLKKLLGDKGFRLKTSGLYGITFEKSEQIKTSILKSGVMILQIPPEKNNYRLADALDTYRSILIDELGLSTGILARA